MCGIVGYMGNSEIESLEKASFSITHRGPDDSGIWVDQKDRIGLAHRRLSIIDLSQRGHQPMLNANRNIIIVINGEIYNYRELKKHLLQKGYTFKSSSDTEVLLYLYEEYGHEMLVKINGMFAFAIWDSRKKELFLARDGLGVKPLYFTENKEGFYFASEIKALMCFEEVKKEINPLAVYYALAYLWTPAPDTMLKNVKKLEPGFYIVVKENIIVKKRKFYDLPYYGEKLECSEKEIISMLEERLFNAVKRQLVADVPVGAFLSGGLDSSSIVAMMKKYKPQCKVKCYCIGFDGELTSQEISDVPYAKQVANHLNVDLTVLTMREEELYNNLENMIYLLDEPQADIAPVYVMMIAKKAREDGIKVLLSGAGGDDIFSGYRRHVAVSFEKYWAWLPKPIRIMLQKYSRSGSKLNPNIRRIKRLFAYASLTEEERLYTYYSWCNDFSIKTLLNRDFSENLKGHDLWHPLKSSLMHIPNEKEPLNRMLYLDAKHFLTDHNLNYTDKASMAYGVEVRVPLLDIDLVDLACKIPSSLKQKNSTGKYIFKKTMENYLPKNVIYRSKMGFGASMRGWHKSSLKEMIEDTLSKESIKNRGIFEYNSVNELLKKDKLGVIDSSYTIFSMICLEIWCRQFIDGKFPIASLSSK